MYSFANLCEVVRIPSILTESANDRELLFPNSSGNVTSVAPSIFPLCLSLLCTFLCAPRFASNIRQAESNRSIPLSRTSLLIELG